MSFDKRLRKIPLPKELTLYTMDADHFTLATHESPTLNEQALVKLRVSVESRDEAYFVKLPESVYRFYRLEESDYTVMVSEKNEDQIIVTL